MESENVHGAHRRTTEIISYGNTTLLPTNRIVRNRPEKFLAPPSAGAPDESPIQWKKLFRYKGTIGLVFILVLATGLTMTWLSGGPQYIATGKVHVRPIIPRLVFQTDETGPIPFYESYANTQMDLIRNPKVLQRVLKKPEIKKIGWEEDIGAAIEELGESLKVKHEPGTETIEVSFGTRTAKEAALVVNTVLKEYLNYIREGEDQNQDYLYQELLGEYQAIQADIETRQKRVSQLSKEIGTGIPDTLVSERRLRLDQAEAKVVEVEQAIELAQKQAGSLSEVKTAPGAKTEATVTFESDAEWIRLNSTYQTVRLELQMAQTQYGEHNRKIMELRAKVIFAEEQLREREAYLKKGNAMVAMKLADTSLDDSAKTSGQIPLPQQINLLIFKKELLLKNLQKQTGEFERIFNAAKLLSAENETIRYKKELRDTIRARLDQKELERKVPGSIGIMNEAMVPAKPAKDRRWKLSIAVFCVALASGFGVGQFRAQHNQTIHEVQDLPSGVEKPFLGQVPLIQPAPSFTGKDDSVQSEYIRMIRTALLQRLRPDQGNMIVITSAEFGVGKTTVAMLLSRSLAECRKNILLIEGDLRRPSMAQRLGIEPGPGLISLLRHKAADEEAILGTDDPYLNILPAGNPSELFTPDVFSNGVVGKCLDRWRRIYDVVVVDTPPVLPVADARILSRLADGTIMVVREGNCHRKDILDALGFLDTCGATFLGLIYIGAEKRTSKYQYGYYAAPPVTDEKV